VPLASVRRDGQLTSFILCCPAVTQQQQKQPALPLREMDPRSGMSCYC